MSEPDKRLLVIGFGVVVSALIGIIVVLTIFINSNLAGGWFSNSPQIGSIAPNFVLDTYTSEKTTLKEFRGKPVLVNFWASWCGPCIAEIPIIQNSYLQNSNNFEVLAINAGESQSRVRNFVIANDIKLEVLLDLTGEIQELYRVNSYPTSYFIDSNGIIRAIHIGILSESQLTRYLKMVESVND
jgi:thiol-disulfide isomerase/thioredoxin